MPSTLQVVPQRRTARVTRRPQHTFNVLVRPWQIVPFFIAPVLPGETMKNMLFQARAVTDPIKSPLVGWWFEMYFWYVKHRDLDDPYRSDAVRIMTDPSYSMPLSPGVSAPVYQYANSVPWNSACYSRVVATYFRDSGESIGPLIGSIYAAAQITQQTALDSALLESAYLAGTADDVVIGADDTISGQEISQSWILWQQYRAANVTHLSYEEYLATYGIPLPQGSDSERRPELVRYVKDWSYPTNTINPTDGTPTSAVSWAVAERADKDRFFREPGFLYGCVCVRPKVYLSKQQGSVCGALKDALSWLPAVMGDNPEYSMRKFTANSGPYPAVAADYRVDLKDLFLYGEQYTNYDLAVAVPATGPNVVALPDATLGKKYPSSGDADAVFKSGTANSIRIDGVVSLNILGQQIETTPTRAPGTF